MRNRLLSGEQNRMQTMSSRVCHLRGGSRWQDCLPDLQGGHPVEQHKQCFSCVPACETCSVKPNNCTSCKSGLKPVTSPNGNSCIQDTTCNNIKHCTGCLTPSTSTAQVCSTCQSRYYSFRRGCARCKNPCVGCQFDLESFWNEVVGPFWNQTRINLENKIASSTKRRLLDPNNNNNNNNNNGNNGKQWTENYKNWTMADWDAANWTSQQLMDYENMTVIKVKGWTQAYFFFKAAQTQLSPSQNLTNLIYNCLPIMQQLLDLTYQDQNQWKHLARFVSKFSTKKWNAPKLNNKMQQIATEQTMCTSCQPGFSLSTDTGLCVKCPDNCATCFQNKTCSSCSGGYFLNKTTTTCNKCSDSCLNCSMMATNCTACLFPLSLASNVCVQCVSPCSTCYANNLSKCVTCNSTYSLLANTQGTCIKCVDSKCRQCNLSNVEQCLSCQNGSVLSGSTCVACSNNCTGCTLQQSSTTATVCYQCDPGFALTASFSCSACPSSCQLCLSTNTSICLACKPDSNTYLDYKTGICTPCAQGCSRCRSDDECEQFEGGVVIYDGVVVGCMPGCLTCDSSNPSLCTKCMGRYYLDTATSTCKKCRQYCEQCTSATNCSSCTRSALLKDGVCVTCSDNCATCSASNLQSCLSCRRGLVLSGNTCQQSTSLCERGCISCSATAPTVCTECDKGYALTSDAKCRKCLGGCTGSCSASNILNCISCMDGFYLKNNECMRCPAGCSLCGTDGTCTGCVEGYTLDSTKGVCNESCLNPCATCTSTSCTTCKSGYVKQNGKCVVNITCNPECSTCLAGSQQNPTTLQCVRCPSDCATCSSGVCSACFDGFYLDSSSKCVACSPQCYTCYDANTCKVCAVGYTKEILSDGKKYTDLVFGDRCIACNPNCKDCNIYKNRCSACKDGFRLRGEKCIGSYTCKYRAKLNYDYRTFISSSASDNFLAAFLNRTGLDSYRVVVDSISEGSTIVDATVSADSQAQATQLQNQLQNVASVGGFQIISSNSDVAYNDQTVEQSNQTFQGSQRTAIIIGCSVGGFVLLLIVGFLVYKCCCLNKAAQNSYQDREMVYSTDKPQVLEPGQGEYGYTLGNQNAGASDNHMYSIY